MKYPEIYYKEPVYRPPSEARSLLIQATEGCAYSCSFCIGNEGKKFLIRSIEDINRDIYNAKLIYGDAVRKMFLLDGNAFVIKPDMLIEIAKYSYKTHPNLSRIGTYAHAGDILSKTDEEMRKISEAGIKIAYLGIETGDDQLLKEINKRTTADELAEAAQKLHRAGITMSGTIILGLTGSDKEAGRRHAVATAKLINRMKPENKAPWYISALTLMLPPGTRLSDKVRRKEFKPMANLDILQELRIIFENLDNNLDNCIFRSNHSSNYLPLESNNLARNKNQLIEMIDHALKNPETLRREFLRGL